MPLGSLKVSHNFAGETGYVVAVWRKTSAPLAIVGQQSYPAPHSQESLLIINLEPDWYTIKFYRSVDGIALGAEILTLAGNAADGAVYNEIKYEYVIDRGYDNTAPVVTGTEVWSDPVNGTNTLRDERLKDQLYRIEIRAIGTTGSWEYTDRSDLGGGFDIITGAMWESEQVVFVFVMVKQDVVTIGGGTTGGEVTDVVIIDDDIDFDPVTHAGKLLVVELTAGVRRLTIPNFATIPDCFFKLQTHGSQYFFGIQLDAGDTANVLGDEKNVVWVGIGEEVSVLVRTNAMYFVVAPRGYNTVGQRVWGEKLEKNSLYRDGTQYNQADVPRLVEHVHSLDASFICAEGILPGQWSYSQLIDGVTVYPNKGKYALTETGTPKIRVPDDRDKYIRALKTLGVGDVDDNNVTNNPGGYQHDWIKIHIHTVDQGNSYLAGSGGILGRGSVSPNLFNTRSSVNSNANVVQNTVRGTRMIPLVKI